MVRHCWPGCGPAVGPDAYEVGADVHDAVVSAFGISLAGAVLRPGARTGKWHLNLFALAKQRLAAAGVHGIYGKPHCTYADPRFYSYRREWDDRPHGDGGLQEAAHHLKFCCARG